MRGRHLQLERSFFHLPSWSGFKKQLEDHPIKFRPHVGLLRPRLWHSNYTFYSNLHWPLTGSNFYRNSKEILRPYITFTASKRGHFIFLRLLKIAHSRSLFIYFCLLSSKSCSVVKIYCWLDLNCGPVILSEATTLPTEPQSVWPDKNRQMSIKVAQKWFH